MTKLPSLSPLGEDDGVEDSHPSVESRTDSVRELARGAQNDGARGDPNEIADQPDLVQITPRIFMRQGEYDEERGADTSIN